MSSASVGWPALDSTISPNAPASPKGPSISTSPTRKRSFARWSAPQPSPRSKPPNSCLIRGDDESAESQLRRLSARWWEFLRSDRFQVVQRLVLAELQHFPDLMQFYADEVVARGKRLTGGVVARGTARGEFRALPPETAARMLSALTMMHSLWCSRRQFFPMLAGTSDEAICNEVLDFYLHALRPDRLVATGSAPSYPNP